MIKPNNAASVMADGCLCFRARRVTRALTRMYDDALRPVGLRAAQLTMLNAVALHGRGGATLRGLGDTLAMKRATVLRTLRVLSAAGLVIAERGEDRRIVAVHITEAGHRRIDEALPAWREAQAGVERLLGTEAVWALRAGLDAVVPTELHRPAPALPARVAPAPN